MSKHFSLKKTVSFVPQDLESHDTYKPTLSMNINDRYIDPAILTYTSINSISYITTNARDKQTVQKFEKKNVDQLMNMN